jgi:hypothetical protein
LSAKRRTLALVNGTSSHAEIAAASSGFELPATSLIEPFFAEIAASPFEVGDTLFNISSAFRNPRYRGFRMCEGLPRTACRWQYGACVYPAKTDFSRHARS